MACLSPKRVGAEAIGLACGAGSTAMWTANGELLTMGANAFGQCGLGFASAAVELPSLVGRVGAVRGASLGFRHGLCFGSEGELWAWGKNDNGQLGLGSRDSRLAPQRVEALAAVRVAAAACGLSHSAALDCDGRLHVWGKMRAAEVQKERRPGLSLPRVYADALEPREIVLQTSGGGYRAPRAPLKALACSNFHTVVLDARNDIWVLGLERVSREMTPKPRLLLGLPPNRSWILRERAFARSEEANFMSTQVAVSKLSPSSTPIVQTPPSLRPVSNPTSALLQSFVPQSLALVFSMLPWAGSTLLLLSLHRAR